MNWLWGKARPSARGLTLVLSPDCACSPEELFADGSCPEWFTDQNKAAMAFQEHVSWERNHPGEAHYWGVHLNGRHVLNLLEAEEQ